MRDDDAAQLAELSQELPALDLDGTTAERIARRARHDLGHGPPLSRVVEPVVAAVVGGGYLVWTVLKVLEALR